MSWLKKLGLIEEVPQENVEMEVPEIIPQVEEVPEGELDDVNTDTLIEDIYTQNDLYDKSKSIFKVEELINSLPKEMVTETKKASVLAILDSFGLTVMEIVDDGEKRIQVLGSIKDKINSESDISIADKETQIENHKKAIAELEAAIASEKEEMRISNEMISGEVTRVTDLMKFIGGGEI